MQGAALPATGQEDLYDGFGNKSALKVGRAGAGIDVDGTLGASFKAAIAEAIYPIGQLYFHKIIIIQVRVLQEPLGRRYQKAGL